MPSFPPTKAALKPEASSRDGSQQDNPSSGSGSPGQPMSRRRRFTIKGLSGGMPSRCRKCMVSRAHTAHPTASARWPPIMPRASCSSSSSSSPSLSPSSSVSSAKSSSSCSSRMRRNASSRKFEVPATLGDGSGGDVVEDTVDERCAGDGVRRVVDDIVPPRPVAGRCWTVLTTFTARTGRMACGGDDGPSSLCNFRFRPGAA
uniref:Uncharacterized protein n=1 Tax=Anopheles atroparvus TaxID=41427 RepID=A0A182IZ11_ANOAO